MSPFVLFGLAVIWLLMGFYGMISFVNSIASIGWKYRKVLYRNYMDPFGWLLFLSGPIGFLTGVVVSIQDKTHWATWTPEKE